MIYRDPLTVDATEITFMKQKGIVVILFKDMELEGTIGEIIFADNDPTQFAHFDLELTPECKEEYEGQEIPPNFTALEIKGIRSK
jgi:hypothetical protein